MITVTRRIEFDAGHRVLNHEGKCKFLHGHRYRAEITVSAPELDSLGRVIDFGVIKEKVGGWIDENWDHNLILNPQDPMLDFDGYGFWGGQKPFQMLTSLGNPTAENMAKHLYIVSCDVLKSPMRVVRVRLYETPNSFADYTP